MGCTRKASVQSQSTWERLSEGTQPKPVPRPTQSPAPRPDPATPGGKPWSEEEKAEVRKILVTNFQRYRGKNVFSTTNPTAPKMVRLAFHDCMKYEDGTGGCDGCLNWESMDFTLSNQARANGNLRKNKPNWVNGNRGLQGIVEYLETVYTTKLRATGRSLKETDKSRADLWAFATIAAIDFTINVNNDACKGRNNRLGVLKTTCLQDADPLGCEVSLPRP